MTQPIIAVEPFILIHLSQDGTGTGFDVQTFPAVSEAVLLQTLEALVEVVRASVND